MSSFKYSLNQLSVKIILSFSPKFSICHKIVVVVVYLKSGQNKTDVNRAGPERPNKSAKIDYYQSAKICRTSYHGWEKVDIPFRIK